MGLRAGERRALHSIEDGLAVSDPKLASLLATFTRLTASEALPGRETIPNRPPGESLRRQLVWPLLWFVTSVALIAMALALSHTSGEATCTSRTSACTEQMLARTGW